jgi:hypothetical protein
MGSQKKRKSQMRKGVFLATGAISGGRRAITRALYRGQIWRSAFGDSGYEIAIPIVSY